MIREHRPDPVIVRAHGVQHIMVIQELSQEFTVMGKSNSNDELGNERETCNTQSIERT
ncbi:MAG: hypothetical protein ACTSWN_03065 [Promethearchaeota archaeon]